MSIVKHTLWQNFTLIAACRPVLNSNTLKTGFSRSMTRTGNTNNAVRMCVKKAIKVRLKQLIVRLMQLKNLVA